MTQDQSGLRPIENKPRKFCVQFRESKGVAYIKNKQEKGSVGKTKINHAILTFWYKSTDI